MGAEWTTCTLADVAAATASAFVDGPFGSALPASDYTPTGVPVIRGSNLTLGSSRFVDEGYVFVSESTAERLHRALCRPGDIVFTKKGTIGQTGIVPSGSRFTRFLLSSNQMKLTVDPSRADPLFVYYAVSCPGSREKIIRDASVTGVPKINLGYIRRFPIPLPALPVQRAIANILGTLDDKIELNRQTNETLETMVRALFKSWFVDFDPVRAKAQGRQPSGMDAETAKLFPREFEDSELGEIPKGWNVRPIGELADVVGGSTPSTKEPVFWGGGMHCWATPKDLSSLSVPVLLDTERRITDAGLGQISSGLLPPGTVLLSSRAPIGYLAIAEVPVAINQGFIAMKPRQGVPSAFLLLWARENHEAIVSRANGSTFLEISKSNFRPIPAVMPPANVLAAFDRVIASLYDDISLHERESRNLATIRDALLPYLLSGELSVSSAENVLEAQA